jgi:iron complex outermembrane recepter protein
MPRMTMSAWGPVRLGNGPRTLLAGALGLCVTLAALAAEDNVELQEIVVTAQKQSQDLERVPISVSAFTGDQLEAMGAQRVTDVMAHVPNVAFFSFFGEAQTPSLCFRGVCLNQQFSDSFEAPVAMYTDEVYVGTAFAQALQLFDIDRIEVLKGPQGTLYGRNTTGGLVNVVTRKPSAQLQANLDVEYGSHNSVIVDGGIGGPIIDGVTGRIAAQVHKADGYVHGAVDNADANNADTRAVRGALDFKLGADADFLLSGHYLSVDQGPQAYAINGTLDPTTLQPCNLSQLQTGSCVGIFADNTASARSLYGRFDPAHWLGVSIPGGGGAKNVMENSGANGTLNWQAGPVQVVSISAYNRSRKDYIEDLDGNLGQGFEDRLQARSESYSEELRGSGEWGGSHLMLGGFYYHDRIATGTALFPAEDYADESTKTTQSQAVYANAEVPLPVISSVHLLLGGRYTAEKRDVAFSRSGFFTDPVTDTTRHVSNNHFDYRAGLQWTPDERTLVYGSLTTSFRSANMNNQFIFGDVTPGATLDALAPVKPEVLKAYEVGTKLKFWEGRARVNVSAYYYDISDLQFLIFQFDPALGFGSSVLRNVGKVEDWGGEADFVVQVTRHLELSLGAGTVKSQIQSTALIAVGDSDVSLDGHELPFSNPSLNGSATYRIPLAERGDLSLEADYSWMARHYFQPTNTVTAEGPAYGVANARVTWTDPTGHFSVEARGDNVFNKHYYVFAGDLFTTTQDVVWGNPRWWTVRLSYKY